MVMQITSHLYEHLTTGAHNAEGFQPPTLGIVKNTLVYKCHGGINLQAHPSTNMRGDQADFTFIGDLMQRKGRPFSIDDLEEDTVFANRDRLVYGFRIAMPGQPLGLENQLKIGYSEDMPSRGKVLQSGCPEFGHLCFKFNPVRYTTASWETSIHNTFPHRLVPGGGEEKFNLTLAEISDLIVNSGTEAQMARYLFAARKPEARVYYNTIHQFLTEGTVTREKVHRMVDVDTEVSTDIILNLLDTK